LADLFVNARDPASNVTAHHGVLDDGVSFIQKPFSIKELAAKVCAWARQRSGGHRRAPRTAVALLSAA
jgi:DNA-binding response OmpR family regulator